ncbi:MAG TPA: hypothetical protein VJT73_12150 [Polyangiaceae bacterium]|nr:hypothetical protein [Polyangiaceae bacterium]
MANPLRAGAGTRGTDFRKKFIMGGSLLALLPTLGFVLYTFVMLKMSYSDGDRSGILQKFSRKGWICKTYEGELSISYTPGLAPTIWAFSVRDEATASQVNAALGKKVILHYAEHRGVPTDCFGETQYYVDGVRIVE